MTEGKIKRVRAVRVEYLDKSGTQWVPFEKVSSILRLNVEGARLLFWDRGQVTDDLFLSKISSIQMEPVPVYKVVKDDGESETVEADRVTVVYPNGEARTEELPDDTFLGRPVDINVSFRGAHTLNFFLKGGRRKRYAASGLKTVERVA